ncbi:MAG: phage portal protein [Clostridiales bacterium]
MKNLPKILETNDFKALESYLGDLMAEHLKENNFAKEGRLYYENENAIRRRRPIDEMMGKAKLDKNPLRSGDFKISHNWHQLLVNQKVAYLFSYPPSFDCGSAVYNAKIAAALGEDFSRIVKNLAIDAANCGVGWLHMWKDAEGRFAYTTIAKEEIYPIYGDVLGGKPQYVLRVYDALDHEGKVVEKIEVWDKESVRFFIKSQKSGIAKDLANGMADNCVFHGMGNIPFVPFYNNRSKIGDLAMVKDLIDQYDLVVSGFANDLADIQEVIFVLRNYGGEDLNTFLSDLKRYKAIKVEGDNGSDGGVETMKIEIPVEARVKFLDLLKKQIFISGQGINPDPESFGNSSGVALKYLYSLLEIKAGLLETEFRSGFKGFLEILLHFLGLDENMPVLQIYSRNSIENEMEDAEIAAKSQGIVSQKTIVRNHPWVEDAEQEMMLLHKEKEHIVVEDVE